MTKAALPKFRRPQPSVIEAAMWIVDQVRRDGEFSFADAAAKTDRLFGLGLFSTNAARRERHPTKMLVKHFSRIGGPELLCDAKKRAFRRIDFE